MEKLKPCKYCGGKARVICETNENAARLIVWWVKCETCGSMIANWFEVEDDAVRMWNEANV